MVVIVFAAAVVAIFLLFLTLCVHSLFRLPLSQPPAPVDPVTGRLELVQEPYLIPFQFSDHDGSVVRYWYYIVYVPAPAAF